MTVNKRLLAHNTAKLLGYRIVKTRENTHSVLDPTGKWVTGAYFLSGGVPTMGCKEVINHMRKHYGVVLHRQRHRL